MDTRTAERWPAIAALLDLLLPLPPGERAARLAVLAADDATLAALVAPLLEGAGRAPFWLDGDAEQHFGALLPDGEAASDPAPGAMIDRYRLVRELGRGGMGVVYLAEREGDGFRQTVALKLIKRGMDTDQVLTRFALERRILAGLTHPHIARLLDGGSAPDGRPYLVMEYVDGVPLVQYAEQHRLSTRERVALLLPVCDAVAYAHRQLVVHRDLKPANILITADGTPKLLDFGIARVLDDDDGATTMVGLRALTPEYASPEQVVGARTGTQADVYSLGVVLYELLTGTLPYHFPDRSAAAMAAVVAREEPALPSASVTPRGVADVTRLRGDLDTIVLMALRKEPERRYPGVALLADDLRRVLAGRPVRARTDSVAYRASRFVRRHAVPVAIAATALLVVVGGAVVVATQARATARHAARAARRFTELRQLAHAVLFDYHDAVRTLPGATPVRQRLVRDGLTYLDGLRGEAGDDPAFLRELGAAYARLGEVQGGTLQASLGDTRGAIAAYRTALTLLDPLVHRDPADTAARWVAGKASRDLGMLLLEAGDAAAALTQLERGVAALRAVLQRAPSDSAREVLSSCLDYRGIALATRGNLVAARASYDTALAQLDSVSAVGHGRPTVRRAQSVVLEHVGVLLQDQARAAEALVFNQRALALRRTLAAEDTLNADLRRTVGVAAYYVGEALATLGRVPEAAAAYAENADVARTLMARDPTNEQYRGDLAYAEIRLGDMLARGGEPATAARHYETSRALRAADVARDSVNVWKRASWIEAQSKVAQMLAVQRDGRAPAELAATAAAMAASRVDSSDALLSSFYAETEGLLGAAWMSWGGGTSTACQAGARHFARALAGWTALRVRGLASAMDSVKQAAVAAQRDAAERRCRRA